MLFAEIKKRAKGRFVSEDRSSSTRTRTWSLAVFGRPACGKALAERIPKMASQKPQKSAASAFHYREILVQTPF
jgi:hypothetical protein